MAAKCANVTDEVKEALQNIAMQVAAMSPEYLRESDISDAEKAKMLEITTDSALNDPASLPKPILSKLIDKAVGDKKWTDEDISIYEEKKSNMNFLFNFLSEDARKALIEIAMGIKESIVSDKIFEGLACA